MKRIPLSLATGLMLVTDYMIAAAFVFSLSGENKELLPYLGLPTSLPKTLFSYFWPVTQVGNQKMALQVAFFIANALLYAIPAYMLLTLLSGMKEEKR